MMQAFMSIARSWRALCCLGILVLLLHPESARAEWRIRPAPPANRFCDLAIDTAERRNATPPQLLAAIGRVESGRRDPIGGGLHPWPWTANAEGQGFYYDTKADAVAAVRAMQGRGIRSIDIGCMQVNLMYHPDAFANLEQAFDPQANAHYAGRFLRDLFARTRDWPKAVALYHSATPGLAADYQTKVMAIWPGTRKALGGSPQSAMAQAWAATLSVAPGATQPRTTPPALGQGAGRGRRAPAEMPPATTWASALR
jgi:hypothetical protein